MMRTIIAAAVVCTVAAASAGMEFPGPDAAFHTRSDRIVVRVAGIPITTGMLIRKNLPTFSRLYQTRALDVRAGGWSPAKEQEFLKYWDLAFRQTLAISIRDELMYLVAKQKQLVTSSSMLEKRTEEFISRIGGESVLKERGLNREDIENEMRKQLQIETVLQTRKPPISPVGPEETKAFYEKKKELFTLAAEGYRLRLISIPQKNNKGEDNRGLVEEVLRKAREGADFAALAAKYSSHPSRKFGGLIVNMLSETLMLDIVTALEIPSVLRDRLQGMEEGAVAAPMEAEGAFHIVLLEKRFKAGGIPFSEVSGSIMQHLTAQAEDRALMKWVLKLAEAHGVTNPEGGKADLKKLLRLEG